MELTPTQIAIITISFAGVFLIALFWYFKDKLHESKEKHVESFSVLMSVFFWSVVFAFIFKMALDLLGYYNPNGIYYTTWFMVLSLFLEEIVKIAALLMGIELAGKRFNELSDGVIYTVFAVLGFLFLENIIYLVPQADDFKSFIEVFAGRNIFTFAMHLFTVIFGVFYAFAYLRSAKIQGGHRVRPEQITKQFKILWDDFGVKFFIWLPFSPFVTLWKFFNRGFKKITIPEMLWSGFLSSSYLHIGYDLLLEADIAMVNMFVFLGVILFLAGLYWYFNKLDVKVG